MSPIVRLMARIPGLLLLGGVILSFGLMAHAGPGPTALQAFEAIVGAEASGADVSNLVAQYNSLLQQGAPDSSYSTLKQLAGNAQASAASSMSFNNSLTLILVPLIALAPTFVLAQVLEFRKKLSKQELLDMEIVQG
jgi:hypothetical protein